MVKLPETFKFLGQEWKIVVTNKDLDARWGECDITNRTVKIHSDTPKDKFLEIVIHELGHVIVEELKLKMNHKTITVYSKALAGLFLENPQLTKALFK